MLYLIKKRGINMRIIKISAFIFALIICVAITGCSALLGGTDDHICEFSNWELVEEPTCKEIGLEERYCYYCDEEQTRRVETLPHTPVQYEGYSATCTEDGQKPGIYCSECMGIISGLEKIKAKGHTPVIDPAVEATETTPGRTEGKHCSTCNEVLVKQTMIFFGGYNDQEKYHGDYAYKSLLSLKNGQEMAEFYNEIDVFASEFHLSVEDAKIKENSENDVYYMAEVYFSDNGLTKDEALSAWSAYLKDHPLYYWMSVQATYTDDYLTLIVDPEYADGDVREQITFEIYQKVEEYITYLGGETEAYEITLGLHDLIISGADYAYEEDGVTPSSERSAHNIIGVLLEGEGVCESYAKTFQMLLNFYDIENIFVTGYAGESHAWNLVQLDNGEWYWYDLTWDDQPEWLLGVRHNYFCVSDSEHVDWSDGSTSKTTKFLEDHIPDAPGGVGVYYSYSLPDAADTPYVSSGIMVRDDILTGNGLSYVLVGYKTVALIDIASEGDIVIPESITYNGDTFTVAMIGEYDRENGVFTPGSVIDYNSVTREHIDVTSIYIPKTVLFIWDYAFDYCYTIESFTVSEDNPAFASQDGVLFTKSLYTLIKYPLAKNLNKYTIPSATVEMAFGAFGDGGNVFCPEYLETLVIPNTVEVIGAFNGGKGFRNSTPEDSSDVIMVDGYLTRLYNMLGLTGVKR